jgi:glutathione S-transferase
VLLAADLKGIPVLYKPISAEQAASTSANKMIPILEHEHMRVTESLAMIEYLESAFPTARRLIPPHQADAAKAREIALIVNCRYFVSHTTRTLNPRAAYSRFKLWEIYRSS